MTGYMGIHKYVIIMMMTMTTILIKIILIMCTSHEPGLITAGVRVRVICPISVSLKFI